jgi:hypothetical protein
MPTGDPSAHAISDERNPLNRLELPIAEAHSEAMNELLPVAVWVE